MGLTAPVMRAQQSFCFPKGRGTETALGRVGITGMGTGMQGDENISVRPWNMPGTTQGGGGIRTINLSPEQDIPKQSLLGTVPLLCLEV